jgi:hypothetical protein
MCNRNVAVLKPQDLAVVLYLCRPSPSRPPYAQIAGELSMSSSEVHAAVARAVASGLLHGADLGHRPNLSALEEFLLHGMKYVFPAERGEPTRGVPTSYAAAPLSALIAPGNDLPPVWPYPSGRFAELLSNRSIAVRRRRPLVTLCFTSTWLWLMLCATVERANANWLRN